MEADDLAAVARPRSLLHAPSGRLTAALVALVIAGFMVLPQQLRGDDAVRAVMLRQLADGVKPDTKYSFVQPLLSTPLYWLFDHLHLGIYAVTLIPMIWLALWSRAMWTLLSVHRSPAFAHHTIVLAIASLLGAYLVGFGSDVFAALGMSGGLLGGLLARARAWRAVGWVVCTLAAAKTPVMFVAAVAVALWLVATERRIRYAALPIAVLLTMTVESTLVTGELSWTRYSSDVEHGDVQLLPWGDVHGFGWPLWSGVLAVLFSFGRGLVFYLPHLWNGPSRGRGSIVHAERAMWLAVLALVPIYGSWWAWYGGASFGPRFFLLATVPAAIATAGVVCDRAATPLRTAVCALSVVAATWVAFSGAVFGVTTTAFERCASPGGSFRDEALCLYRPEYSGLWAPIWAADPIGLRDLVFLGTLLALVAPTLATLTARLRSPARRQASVLGRHLRGRWTL